MANATTGSNRKSQATTWEHEEALEEMLDPIRDCVNYMREYTQERPGIVAVWCLGIGFILGWKLKPW